MKELLPSEQWYQKKLERARARKDFVAKALDDVLPVLLLSIFITALFFGLVYCLVGGVLAHEQANEITTLQNKVRTLEWRLPSPIPNGTFIVSSNGFIIQ